MKIIVTGSLGHISKPLTEKLIARGHEVTVISSNADKASSIINMGATAAIGSVEDLNFIKEVFSTADAVYTMVPPVSYMEPNLDPIRHFTKIGNIYADAIAESTIRRVVNLSSWGAHRDNGTGGIVGTYHLEQIFNRLAVNFHVSHIRPTSFYYNLLGLIPVIKHTGKISANYGAEDVTVLVSPEDIAEAVAEEIEVLDSIKKVRYVASDELSCNEVAHILGKSIGMPDLVWELITPEQAQQNLERAGLPKHSATLLVELQQGHHSGIIAEDYRIHRPQLGKVKLTQYAEEFAVAFRNYNT